MQPVARKRCWIATAVVALGLLVWRVSTGLERGTAAGEPEGASSPARVTRSPEGVDAALDPARDEPSRAAVAPVTAVREEIPVGAVPITSRGSPATSIGKLLVRVVDATTDEPLRSFHVRLLSDASIAERRTQAPGTLEVLLTAGTYSLVVSSPGYESVEARGTVIAGQTSRAETARLRTGAGVIVAEVLGVARDRHDLAVELIGVGRRPCERCGDVEDPDDDEEEDVDPWERDAPCSFCGFSRDRSRLGLSSGRRAEFRGLASGNYALRVRDGRDRVVCEDREVSLPAIGIEHVTFELSRDRTVEVEFLDVDGESLSDEWRRRMAETDDEPEEEIGGLTIGVILNPIHLAFSDDTSALVASAVVMPPIPSGASGYYISRAMGSARRASASTDRARQPEDLLWPAPEPARFDPEISCEIDEKGLARVGPLPSSHLTLHATAENFSAEVLVPASRADTRVTLRLRSTVPAPEATPELATYGRYEQREPK